MIAFDISLILLLETEFAEGAAYGDGVEVVAVADLVAVEPADMVHADIAFHILKSTMPFRTSFTSTAACLCSSMIMRIFMPYLYYSNKTTQYPFFLPSCLFSISSSCKRPIAEIVPPSVAPSVALT